MSRRMTFHMPAPDGSAFAPTAFVNQLGATVKVRIPGEDADPTVAEPLLVGGLEVDTRLVDAVIDPDGTGATITVEW